jgi:cytochrome c oxidase subunit 2
VNKNILVLLGSHDVIHSFFIPQVRLKQDTLPGREIRAWFNVKTPGVYEIPCAELCGFGHSGMKGTLTVQSEAEWAAWFKEQTAPAGGEAAPAPAGDAAPPAGQEPAPAGGAAPAPAGAPAPAPGSPS